MPLDSAVHMQGTDCLLKLSIWIELNIEFTLPSATFHVPHPELSLKTSVSRSLTEPDIPGKKSSKQK